jgi:hypothetical protein
MPKKTKRRFIPSSAQSRYLGLLKKLGGETLVVQGKAVLARIRARRPAPAEALGGITGVLPVPKAPPRGRPTIPGSLPRCLPPSDILGRAECCGRCKKLNGERSIAECVAGCMGLLELKN